MTFRKPDDSKGATASAQPTVAGSEEAVQLALEQLRNMGQRFRTASKEQQVLIQATHVQWASMTDTPEPTPQTTVHMVGQTVSARQEGIQSSMSGLESHVSTLQIEAPRGFHELTGISDVRELLKGQITESVASLTTATSVHNPISAGSLSTLTHPNPDALQKGVTTFFSYSNQLFHVFTEDQIADYQRARLSGSSDESRNYATCVVSAVAAVGLQYMPDDIDTAAAQSLYAIARNHYDLLLEFSPLEAMKVCALFVLYNAFAKSTVALAYIEVGLSLCHQFGIDKPASPSQEEQEQWFEYRRTWRTLLFFSGWLSSTLGYVSGDDTLVRAIPLSEIEPGNPSDISQVAQSELVKISLLKLRIIRMQEAFGEHSVLAVASTRSDLKSWYSSLPQAVSITSLSQYDLHMPARKTIYNLNILYLGAMMLLYRRVASHIVRLSRSEQSVPLQQQQDELLGYIVEGREAARYSAAVLNQFYYERDFCKRCWLVIFHAYTACLVLLFSVVQGHVEGSHPDVQQQDLEKARQCLEILEWCGTVDRVARQFHRTLSACYEALITAGMTTPTQENPSGASPFYPGATTTAATPHGSDSITKFFSIPPSGDLNFHRHAYKLLDLLCRPFSDPYATSDGASEAMLPRQLRQNPSGFEAMLAPERMEWNPGSRMLFQWDLAKIGIPATPSQWPDVSSGGAYLLHAAESMPSSNHFVGDMRPSGWDTTSSLLRLC